MSDVLKWLIGLRQLPSGAAEGDWRLELQSLPSGVSAFACAALFLAAIAGICWLYRLEGRQLSAPLRWMLVGLRTLILGGVVLMLLDVVLVIERHEQIPSHLLVLMDTSESMGLSDPYTDEADARRMAESLGWSESDAKAILARLDESKRYDLATQAVAPLLERLSDGRQVSLFQFDSTAEPSKTWDKLASVPPHGAQTAIGEALRQALAAHRNQPLAGVLLITDGQSNGGEDPLKIAEQAGKQRVPIFSLAVGTERGPSNVRLADLESSPVVFARDPIQMTAIVESQGLQGQGATVRLERRPDGGEWSEVAQTSLTLGEDGAVQRVTFDYTPDAVGQFDFRATVSDVGKELTEADNSALRSVRVIRQQLRVLLVAGYPSPEVQFLRNTLQRENAVEFSSWLQTAGERYEQVGKRPLRRLPATQQELDQYDAILMFDPQVRDLGPTWSELLVHFVGDAGGGLIYVAGEVNAPQLFSAGSVEASGSAESGWLRMLPIVCEPGLYQSSADVRLSSRDTWNLELTAAGVDDPIFRFAPDPNKNREIVASLPGMYWHYPVTRAKPGATVLAQHGDQRMRNAFGRHVLMAMQRYGPGQTVFLGFDSTYRWRYLHEGYFDGFWGRLIDRVGRSKALGGRYPFTLSTDRSVYRAGDRVTLRAQWASGQDESALGTQLRGDVEVPDHEPLSLEFEATPERPDVLQASFPVDKAGAYLVRVTTGATDAESAVRPATLPFRVEPPRQEIDNPRLNRALLDDMARLSDGRVFSLAEARQIPDALRIKQVDRVLQYREELWDAPMGALAIVLLLTVEWVLRKMHRMA